MARYDSFMVRIWRSSVDGREQWSGRLAYLQQGKTWDYDTPDELFRKLRQLAGLEEPASTAPSGRAGDHGDTAGRGRDQSYQEP